MALRHQSRSAETWGRDIAYAEVDDDGRALERCDDVGECLSGLQHDDAIGGERLLVDVGGAGIEVVGDQGRAGMVGVADGMGGLTLPSFDRVEEYGHMQ